MDLLALHRLIRESLQGAVLRRATFGGPQRGQRASSVVRVEVRPVTIRGLHHLQFSSFDGRQTAVQNYLPVESEAALQHVFDAGYSGIHVWTRDEEIDVRVTKKGKVLIGRHAATGPRSVDPSHNRTKDVPLPEGRGNRLLEAMGILTTGGRVRPTMRAKFTQINEFLKHLQHVLPESGLASVGRELEILDCGCGASYLTLAVYHYLNEVLHVPARILGVDVNEEVVRKSVARAEHLGAKGVRIQCAPIGTLETPADIVLALHACDTATDDALARAARSGARLVLSVPCCHHDLNARLKPRESVAVLRALLRHGILRERTADLFTDALRAQALRILGYRTDVVEFVSPEHTSRNLMIRGVRGGPVGEANAVREYLELRDFCGAVPYIERLLGEPFQRILGGTGSAAVIESPNVEDA